MKKHLGIVAAAAMLATGVTAPDAWTQTLRVEVDMNAPAPRLPNGRPDFSGV